ncbi:MAG TPA: potassium-transporting ATPase subunit KdpA [Candidatus Hydrogenedentes bacterium]|nr:potassium-transporting ATPase subunit KdpA [Candidatus Hydrogenedentota bacterium]HOS02236.1 potassium-transporting ATPase subunit KdpA [Candidatus Hydrogenedentota bacterium]
MELYGWIQLALFVGILWAMTKPMGNYLVAVLDAQGKTFLDPAVKPVERFLYRACRIEPQQEQTWKGYALSLGLFSVVGMLFTYAVLRLQQYLPLNPQHLAGIAPDLAFNTAVSFTTNTNWQSYGGESAMSCFSQMVALTFHNFTSAAAGIAVAAALVRGLARATTQTLGNFWVDMVRVTLYLLVPFCLVFALFLVSQGVVQNLNAYTKLTSVETLSGEADATPQAIPQGPIASQEAIKMLGTNGGGFLNANSSHPFENPNPLTNFIQMLSIFLVPSGLTYYLGRMVKNQRHGWTVWAAMLALFLLGVLACWSFESAGNPRMTAWGVADDGNMEGKEVRFGVFNSALFATVTTDASCGAVNAMHDSFTSLGGLVPLLNIHLGEIIFGGVGAGLYGMLIFIILTVFLAGLMVGRTPAYLEKKIEAYDVKLSVLFIFVGAIGILGFAAWACVSAWGVAGLTNRGPHGLSEILYAFSSAVGNNGSAFAGLSTNTPMYNTTLALAMLAGRFLMIVPVLALAGNLAQKKKVATDTGSFPVSGVTFGVLLVGTILIVGALTFFPVLALGPIVEHFIMTTSNIVY